MRRSGKPKRRMSAIIKFTKPTAGNGNPTDVADSLKSVSSCRRRQALTTLDQIRDSVAVVDMAGASPVPYVRSIPRR